MTDKASILKPDISIDFELFFRMSLDIMLIAELDGKIIDFNQAYEKISGYSREELFALNAGWDLVLKEDLTNALQQVELFKTGDHDVINYELRIKCKNGVVKTLSYDASLDKVKKLIYCIGRDITEISQKHKLLEQNEMRLQFFFDNVLDGMGIVFEGKFQLVNKAFVKILGYDSDEEIIGKNYDQFIDPEFHKKVEEIVSSNSNQLYSSRIVRKDGTFRNIEATGKTIQFQDQELRIFIIRDLEELKIAQDKIEESEARFETVFKNSSLGLMLLDFDGNFVDANISILDRLGYSQNEIREMNIMDIIFEDDRDNALEYWKLLISGAVNKIYKEKRFVKKDKKITWVRVTLNIMKISATENIVFGLVEDLDSQKKSEKALIESEEKFREVYESSPMGILITKSPGIIYDLNPAFAEMMGYSEEELKGKNLLDITHASDYHKTKKWIEKIFNREIQTYITEKKYVRKDGNSFWAKAVVSTMNDITDEIVTVAIIENIEKKKKTEDALEQKNRELTQINQELEHFAYVASHDLQEPLRTITSFIQILDKRYIHKLDEDAQQFMGFVVEGAKRMQTLIHDLLEYSRINRFNTGYEKIDLNEIFNTINRVLKDKIESHDALVLSENLPTVYGNRLQLTQVFQNLVDNAIKFKAKKRKPEIIISVNDLGDKWELIFKDNGIGISQEYFQRIFVIFQRLHTHEEYTGTGIGLAICKKIIERHGGEIWVDSKPGKGTAFHLSIGKNLMSAVSN